MNPQDPLAALHPLRTPAAIDWWPPAPGWWALLLAVMLAAALGAYLLRRRYQRNAYRRRALQQLSRAQQDFQHSGDGNEYLLRINALLKSVALLAYPRSAVASSHGAQWRTFLNSSLPQALQLPDAFDDAAYRNGAGDIDLDQLHRAAQCWIRQHRSGR